MSNSKHSNSNSIKLNRSYNRVIPPAYEFIIPNSISDGNPIIVGSPITIERILPSTRSREYSSSSSEAPIYLFSSSTSRPYNTPHSSHRNSVIRIEMESKETKRKQIDFERNNLLNSSAIKIQSVIRRWIIYKRYDKREKYRLCYREDTIRDAENQAIIACKDKIEHKMGADEIMKKLRKEAELILNRKIGQDKEEDKINTLFKKCDTSNKGYLTFSELSYLVYDIFQLHPKEHHLKNYVDPKNTDKISFEVFLKWFKYCIIYIYYYRSIKMVKFIIFS